MRRTRIIATLGPASSSAESVAALVEAGVDVFRLNFSHGSHDVHARTLALVREASARAGRHVAVLQDLSGPKIRTGRLERGEPVALAPGDRLQIATGDGIGRPGRVFTGYEPLAASVHAGDRLLLDDGRIELRVEGSDGKTIDTVVVQGGPLGEHKGINAPGVRLPASSLTDKDLVDLRFGIEQGVDWIALSFVQSADDLVRVREAVAAVNGTTPIIAKIERPEAVAQIDEVLEQSDGVMVARGDLALEMPLEQVPRIQKDITRRARALGVPVIVATQVLESMRTDARPTRAEVSDAANAVDDAVDAIMLSGETAVGVAPRRVVETLDAIIRDAESLPPGLQVPVGPKVIEVPHSRAVCEAAVTLASTGSARAIVAVTAKGRTARVLSAFRPPVPIIAATPTPEVCRKLALYRGVVPVTVGAPSEAGSGEAVERELVDRGVLEPGEVIVFVRVHANLSRVDANFLRIRRVGEA